MSETIHRERCKAPRLVVIRRRYLAWLAVVGLIGTQALHPSRSSRAEEQPSCLASLQAPRVVTAIRGSDALILDDRTEVLLVGSLPPELPLSSVPESKVGDWPPLAALERELRALVGTVVRISPEQVTRDRWGRVPAQVIVEKGSQGYWLQGWLVTQGLARAYGLPGGDRCATELVALEAESRRQSRGIWSNPAYAVRQAGDVAGLLPLTGTFQIVAGLVHRVSQSRGTMYVNFGSNWRTDFTVEIRPETRRILAQSGLMPSNLAGRTVRVRGWIEVVNGPRIQILNQGQIEVLASPDDR